MAKTNGHGNPKWTREETILALNLYFQLGGKIPSSKAQEIIGLSAKLRALPYHLDAAKKPTFRNPDGVVFKLNNIRSVATGKGLKNTSEMDRLIWREFGHRQDAVVEIATAIDVELSKTSLPQLPFDETELPEGRLLTELHLRRERNPKARKLLLQSRKLSGLKCEICDLSRFDLPAAIQDAIFEVHHLVPLARAGERTTKLSDLALLCACCHRMIHQAMAVRGDWIGIAEARELFRLADPQPQKSKSFI